jgi:hypothetical protein
LKRGDFALTYCELPTVTNQLPYWANTPWRRIIFCALCVLLFDGPENHRSKVVPADSPPAEEVEMWPKGVLFCCFSLFLLPFVAHKYRPDPSQDQNLISKLRVSGVL